MWYIDIRKGKHPLQSGCSRIVLNVLTDTAYPVCRQDRHFYFRLFLLSRKASNAITRLPKAHNNVSMPRKIERISKAVIGVTSLPMYSGKPVIGVGRLPPCHGYFPMAFAMLLIYHFSCHNSTIFVNSFVIHLSLFFLTFSLSAIHFCLLPSHENSY